MIKKKKLHTLKQNIWLIALILTLGILLTSLFLQKYLFQIQTIERLQNVEDYSNYIITFIPQKRTTTQKRFSYKNINYYYQGIEQIYVSYGTTTIFLQDALQKEYLGLKSIIKNMTIKENDEMSSNEKIYIHNSSSTNKSFQIKTISYENYQDVFISPYTQSE